MYLIVPDRCEMCGDRIPVLRGPWPENVRMQLICDSCIEQILIEVCYG
jgi:hypothetical protein